MKPLFSDKSISGDKINLTENGEYDKTEMKTAEVFNSFFSNIITNLSRFLSTQILILLHKILKIQL